MPSCCLLLWTVLWVKGLGEINIVQPSNTVIAASSGAVSFFPTLVCWTCRRLQIMWVIVLTKQWRGLLRCPMLSRDSWPNRVVPRVSSTEVAYDWASIQPVSWPALTISFGLMLFSLKASTTTKCSFQWHEVAVAHFFHLSWTGTPAFLLCNFSNFSSGSTNTTLFQERLCKWDC